MASNIVFPCGSIFRASHPSGACSTALVKAGGNIKMLRVNRETWKSPNWWPGYFENKPVSDYIAANTKDGWSLTADVKPPKDWWREADAMWRRDLPPGASHEEKVRVIKAAYDKAHEGWTEYVRRLQALYPVFTRIEHGDNVPLRLIAEQQQPASVLETLGRILETAPQPETITLTRDNLNFIYTMLSGHSMTDDQWDQAKRMAVR